MRLSQRYAQLRPGCRRNCTPSPPHEQQLLLLLLLLLLLAVVAVKTAAVPVDNARAAAAAAVVTAPGSGQLDDGMLQAAHQHLADALLPTELSGLQVPLWGLLQGRGGAPAALSTI
jgi:hypothetical protein